MGKNLGVRCCTHDKVHAVHRYHLSAILVPLERNALGRLCDRGEGVMQRSGNKPPFYFNFLPSLRTTAPGPHWKKITEEMDTVRVCFQDVRPLALTLTTSVSMDVCPWICIVFVWEEMVSYILHKSILILHLSELVEVGKETPTGIRQSSCSP